MGVDTSSPGAQPRREGAFVCLVVVWLALDLPLFLLRYFMNMAGAFFAIWYLILLPYILFLCAVAFAYATYTAVRMTFSENQQRTGVVATVLCVATLAFTVHVTHWWISPATRANESAPGTSAAF